jgi:uncharacterized membrane protein
VKIDVLKGRLGKHRFHPMLVHFPSALYPFSLVMDFLFWLHGNEIFAAAGTYALCAAVGMSTLALIYGTIDFLQLDSKSKAWKVGGVHALLNVTWFIIYSVLLLYALKRGYTSVGLSYLIVMTVTTAGLIFSNFLGAELIIRYRIGVQSQDDKE